MSNAFIYGYVFDESGRATVINNVDDISDCLKKKKNWVWVHLERDHSDTPDILKTVFDLPHPVIDPLTLEDVRARSSEFDDGYLLTLRAANLNPDHVPEDMVAIRCWVTPKVLITTRKSPLMTVRSIVNDLQSGDSSYKSSADLLSDLTARVIDRIDDMIDVLDDDVTAMEELAFSNLKKTDLKMLMHTATNIRLSFIQLKRHLSPQHVALSNFAALYDDKKDHVKSRFIALASRMAGINEEILSLQERTNLIHLTLDTRQVTHSNQVLYLLSIVAAIFLPLGFITGLMGINVGGMPGIDEPMAFWVVVAVCAIIGAVELALLRLLRWI